MGLEKIAYFYRKLTDEATSFQLLYNTLFNSKLIWSYLEGKKTITELNLNLLEKMCSKYQHLRKSYELNRIHFERLLLEQGCLLYLDLFDPAIVERLIDHLVIFGEGVLFIVVIAILEEFVETDISELGTEAGREKIKEVAKSMDPLKLSHRLLTSHEDYDFFYAKRKEIVK